MKNEFKEKNIPFLKSNYKNNKLILDMSKLFFLDKLKKLNNFTTR